MFDQELEIRKKVLKETGEGFKLLGAVVGVLANANKAKAERKTSKAYDRLIRDGVNSLDVHDIAGAISEVLSGGKKHSEKATDGSTTNKSSSAGAEEPSGAIH